MRYGFAIDHRKCIGCHACTVACKSENEVPVGAFRTWVKYLEEGAHPEVRRSFTVLRCNQCEDAPCVTICPVIALSRRPDGIVDLDGDVCIGCKACLQACPYDALYINEGTGTAQKCHYCAHRVERGLKPACEVVCPEHAIIGGDLDDADGELATLLRTETAYVRKPEKMTRPKVFYVGSAERHLDPVAAKEPASYLWAGRSAADPVPPGLEEVPDPAALRAVYDVPHRLHWGTKVSLYLLTKSIAAGAGLFVGLRTLVGGPFVQRDEIAAAAIGLFFLAATIALLVLDLQRPERFFSILTRPNWKSWLVRGAYALMAFGLVLSSAGVKAIFGWEGGRVLVAIALVLTSALAAGYTGFLFNQSRGRDLWLARDLALHLVAQALVAGGAAFLVLDAFGGETAGARMTLLAGVAAHILYVRLRENRRDVSNAARELARKALEPKSRVVEYVLVLALLLSIFPALSAVSGMLAIAGLFAYEDAFVRAGQAPPLS